MNLIKARNIEKIYSDGTHALHGVSFDIKEGEFAAIMGPSGSGKSTLLHIIGFLDTQSAGEYYFNGKSFLDYTPDEVAHIRNQEMGFVFQMFNLLPRATVLENVTLPLVYSSVKGHLRETLARKAIESVGLSHRAEYEAFKLSGGERQRVAIARALVNKPQIIFADEPTGNLDTKSGKAVMEIIERLNEEDGHTIVLITHETHTAEHAQRIIKILDGKVESDEVVGNRYHAREHFKK
ncbi:macrolide ABC transporter ATP-binding protein [bacterium]|nr:macrolide ABC transporter ATP-binding protein [bacterium]|tara:strand:- start:67529 stop:68239 length:711 start_codon:yes stop_codon:yes gene_type:complete